MAVHIIKMIFDFTERNQNGLPPRKMQEYSIGHPVNVVTFLKMTVKKQVSESRIQQIRSGLREHRGLSKTRVKLKVILKVILCIALVSLFQK